MPKENTMAAKPEPTTYELMTAAAKRRLSEVNQKVAKQRKAREAAMRYFDYHPFVITLHHVMGRMAILTLLSMFFLELNTNLNQIAGTDITFSRLLMFGCASAWIVGGFFSIGARFWARHINKEWPSWSFS